MENGNAQRDVKLAKLALQLDFITEAQVKASLDLRKRYELAGGEVPSLTRILVQKGHLPRARAEQLLRHLLKGEPLPKKSAPAAVPLPSSAPKPSPQLPLEDEDLQVADDILPVNASKRPHIDSGIEAIKSPDAVPEEDPEMLLKGLGATVLRSEIKGYKILEVIGEGSMGIVYRAHQISMDRIVALKVLPASKTKDQRFVDKFLTEARSAGRLNHPNLIRVHEVGRSGDTYYYSMEYVDGLSMAEVMDEFEYGRLDPKRAVNIFQQIAAALDHGYRSNIIHREIRLDSIMITEGDQAKLDGLGLTKDETTRFLKGENAYYVAPEQVRGDVVDIRADIYCLGACFFHALTGEPPFHGGPPKDILNRRLTLPAPDPTEINPGLPVPLAQIVQRMMARNPAERYQTPADLMEALKQITFVSADSGGNPITKGPRSLKTGISGRRRRTRVGSRRRRYRR